MEKIDDILVEFIIEAREILDQLDLDFVQLEETPGDSKLVGNIFRGVHTLKGNSGFFAFKRLEKVSHAGETLMMKIRDGALSLDKQKITSLLNALDVLREIISGIEINTVEPVGDDTELIQALLIHASGGTPSVKAPADAPAPGLAPTQMGTTINDPADITEARKSAAAGDEPPALKVAVSGDTTQAGNGIESVAAAAAYLSSEAIGLRFSLFKDAQIDLRFARAHRGNVTDDSRRDGRLLLDAMLRF